MVIKEQNPNDRGKGGRKKGQIQRKLGNVRGFNYPVLLAPFKHIIEKFMKK